MTKPGRPREAAPGQDALIPVGVDLRGRPGRCELAVSRSLAIARVEGKVDQLDDGACALAVELARAVDIANRRTDPFAAAAAGRELREQLGRLRLDPGSRGEARTDDPFDRWLSEHVDAGGAG